MVVTVTEYVRNQVKVSEQAIGGWQVLNLSKSKHLARSKLPETSGVDLLPCIFSLRFRTQPLPRSAYISSPSEDSIFRRVSVVTLGGAKAAFLLPPFLFFVLLPFLSSELLI